MTFLKGTTLKIVATVESAPTSVTVSVYDTNGTAKVSSQSMSLTSTLTYTGYVDTTGWDTDKYFVETTTTSGTYYTKEKKEFNLIEVV